MQQFDSKKRSNVLKLRSPFSTISDCSVTIKSPAAEKYPNLKRTSILATNWLKYTKLKYSKEVKIHKTSLILSNGASKCSLSFISAEYRRKVLYYSRKNADPCNNWLQERGGWTQTSLVIFESAPCTPDAENGKIEEAQVMCESETSKVEYYTNLWSPVLKEGENEKCEGMEGGTRQVWKPSQNGNEMASIRNTKEIHVPTRETEWFGPLLTRRGLAGSDTRFKTSN